jgi:hypothetical protein
MRAGALRYLVLVSLLAAALFAWPRLRSHQFLKNLAGQPHGDSESRCNEAPPWECVWIWRGPDEEHAIYSRLGRRSSRHTWMVSDSVEAAERIDSLVRMVQRHGATEPACRRVLMSRRFAWRAHRWVVGNATAELHVMRDMKGSFYRVPYVVPWTVEFASGRDFPCEPEKRVRMLSPREMRMAVGRAVREWVGSW